MHKVVIERPRWNPGPGKNGRRANLPEEHLPKFEGIKRPHRHRKAFTDLLGPLRRWLQSQLGRPWNDVYSEACEVIKADSVVRAHIKTHLLDFVERNAFMHEGKICAIRPWRNGGITPLTSERFGWTRFYVHPETGLLEKIKSLSRREWRELRREKRAETFRWLHGNGALKQINGIWFFCQFRAVEATGPFKIYDHAFCQMVGRGGLHSRDGVYLHCFAKRQLSRSDLRRFELRNVARHHASAVFNASSSALNTAFTLDFRWASRCGPSCGPKQSTPGGSSNFRSRFQFQNRTTENFMKRKPKTRARRLRELQLSNSWSLSYYIGWVTKLEKIVRKKPRTIRITIVGDGAIAPDAALIIRAALLERSPITQIIMHARSSIQGASVMLWLMGDKRLIRDDAKVYFRPADLPDDIEVDPNGDWKSEMKYQDSFSDFEPEEGDYARVLQIIDEFLPVKEFAGRLIGVAVLKQFGLIENDHVDNFLASAFAKSNEALAFR